MIPPEYKDLSAIEILSQYGYKIKVRKNEPNVAEIYKNDTNEFIGVYSVIAALNSLNLYGEIKKQ